MDLLRRARRLRPGELDYALTYARVAVEFGRLDWAEESLRWARTKHPDDPRPVERLAELLRQQGDVQGAESLRRELESRENPDNSGP